MYKFIFALLVMVLFTTYSEAAGPRRVRARVGRRAAVTFAGRNRAFLFGNRQAIAIGNQAFLFNGRRRNQAIIFAGGGGTSQFLYGNQQLSFNNQQLSYGNQQFSYGNQQQIVVQQPQQIVVQQEPCPTTQQLQIQQQPCPTTQQLQIQQPANMYGTCGNTQQFRFRGHH